MTKDEALKLALEALEMCEVPWTGTLDHNLTEVITAINQALAAPVQEPVAWVRLEAWQSGAEWPDDCFTGIPADGLVPLYTTPPVAQRQWVGLTRKEVHDLYDLDFETFHQRIEAKLKEKNT